MSDSSDDITRLLHALGHSGDQTREELLRKIYRELKRIAANQLRAERNDHTLQPTALVHEAYIRLLGHNPNWEDRSHFYATAAKVMRQILVDYARTRAAQKRGGAGAQVLFRDEREDAALFGYRTAEEVLAIDDALSELGRKDPRQCAIVELRFFCGLTEDEVARLLGISDRTVKRDWTAARAWLFGRLR